MKSARTSSLFAQVGLVRPLLPCLVACQLLACSPPREAEPQVTKDVAPSSAEELTALPTAVDVAQADPTAEPAVGWSAKLTAAESIDGASGVSVQLEAGGGFASLPAHNTLPAGATLKTDAGTRAILELDDGGVIILDQNTELTLLLGEQRAAKVQTGQAIFDLPHKRDDQPNARVLLPTGTLTLLGTKVLVTAAAGESSATVTRGEVQANNAAGESVLARPGDEVLLPAVGSPSLSPSADLGPAAGWTDLGDEVIRIPRGLGSLAAKQPGTSKDDPLEKVSQKVDVTVQGVMAYTEVTEVFSNKTSHTLEGVYRFPLPSDAQISRLALLVDGKLIEGEFVENKRAERIWKKVITQWRDPAWLRWQQGDQFELRIFPIAPNSTRQLTIGYTQRLASVASGRRYVYPMPHVPAGSPDTLKVGQFDFEAKILGQDAGRAVTALGYAATIDAQEGSSHVLFHQTGFTPAGDLVLRVPTEADSDLEVVGFTDAAHPDELGYAVLSLRPDLPRTAQAEPRDLLLVADRSYSRTGLSKDLQTKVITRTMVEMDPTDRVAVIACNERCVPVGGGRFVKPTPELVAEVQKSLEGLAPEGATNLLEAVQVAARILQTRDSQVRAGRIVYFTDGLASAGELEPARLEKGAREALKDLDARLSLVDMGGSSDALALAALARGGRGSVVTLDPAATVASHALSLLGQQYGALLSDATLTLPKGFSQVYPETLPPIHGGEELTIVARVDAKEAAQGELVLAGLVAGEPYQAKFPLVIEQSVSNGNAFAAKLWAEQRIAALQLAEGDHSAEIVEVSKRFGVLSRYTSLLALESTEMMREFGLEAGERTEWDANLEAQGGTFEQAPDLGSLATGDAPAMQMELGPMEPMNSMNSMGSGSLSGSSFDLDEAQGMGKSGGGLPADERAATADNGDEEKSPRRGRDYGKSAAQPTPKKDATPKSPAKPADKAKKDVPWDSGLDEDFSYRQKRPKRTLDIKAYKNVAKDDLSRVTVRRGEVDAQPESITRRKALVRALSLAERFDEARQEARDWLKMNPMDAEALTVSAEIEARLGEVNAAERLLADAVDASPRARWLRERLALAYENIGESALACAHRVSLDSIDGKVLPDSALSCPLATNLEAFGLKPAAKVASTEKATKPPSVRGDLKLELSWSGAGELDLGVIASDGRTTTWLGGEKGTTFANLSGAGPEKMALKHAEDGRWLVDVVRRDDGKNPIEGKVAIEIHGKKKTLAFKLEGKRTTVAVVSSRW